MCRPGASDSYPAPRPDSLHQGPGLYTACEIREPWKLMTTKPFRIGKRTSGENGPPPARHVCHVVVRTPKATWEGNSTALRTCHRLLLRLLTKQCNRTRGRREGQQRSTTRAPQRYCISVRSTMACGAYCWNYDDCSVGRTRVLRECSTAVVVVVALSRLSKSSELKLMYVDSRPGGTETREPIKWPST